MATQVRLKKIFTERCEINFLSDTSHLVNVFCSFELRLRIILSSGKLTLVPRVRNTDSKAFSFTFALRNYLSVSDVRFATYHYLLLQPHVIWICYLPLKFVGEYLNTFPIHFIHSFLPFIPLQIGFMRLLTLFFILDKTL